MSLPVFRTTVFRNLISKSKRSSIFSRFYSDQNVGKALKFEGINKFVHQSLLPSVFAREVKTAEDWKDVRNKLIGSAHIITNTNIDSIVLNFLMGEKRYDLSRDYVKYLKESQGKLNLASTGKYLKLLYVMNRDGVLDEEAAKEVVSIYKGLIGTYKVLDESTMENVIVALSLTDQWETCLKLIDDIKRIGKPTSFAYSAVVAAAFHNNKDDLAWNLAQEMIELSVTPSVPVYITYLNKVKQKRKLAVDAMDKLLNFFHIQDLSCPKEVVEKIAEVAQSKKWKAAFTTVDKRGVCQTCREKLQRVELSQEEFATLKNAVYDSSIVGKDIFCRTTPKELAKFKEFTANMPRYDVVIDGLNVAYAIGTQQSPLVFSLLVRSVVQYFAEQNKRILMLGRLHMSSFPKQNWSYITSHADVFLTESLSQDDPYLLYCALSSGVNTIMVSRDLMRGHIFRLRDPIKKILFNRWLTQCQHQLVYVTAQGKTFFRKPPPYMRTAQKWGTTWHVPYVDDKFPEDTNRWLCLKM